MPSRPPGLTVSDMHFRRQIAWLAARGYSSATVEDCISHVCGNPSSRSLIAITFDDAYASLCDNAFPILQHYGFTALVFVPTALIGQTTIWDEREGWSSEAIMSEEQIRTWLARGIEFGSHTRTHPNLTMLDDAELENEIVGSARDLTMVLDQEVRAFAYPYGHVSPEARTIVSRTYSVAFSTHEGINSVDADPALLCRTMVLPRDGALDLALAVRHGANYRQRLRIRMGRVRRRLWRQ